MFTIVLSFPFLFFFLSIVVRGDRGAGTSSSLECSFKIISNELELKISSFYLLFYSFYAWILFLSISNLSICKHN